MTTNGDDTRPTNPATIARLRLVEQKQREQATKVESIDAAVSLLLASNEETEQRLGAKIDAIRGDMWKGFDRLGQLIDRINDRHDRDHDRAEKSHHDLEAEVQKAKRLIMLKNVSWPTAIVVCVFMLVYFGLSVLHVPMPNWMMALAASVGTAIAGGMASYLNGGKQS